MVFEDPVGFADGGCFLFEMRSLVGFAVLFCQHEDIGEDIGVTAVVAVSHEAQFNRGAVDGFDPFDDHRRAGIPCPLLGVKAFRGDQCAVADVGIQGDVVADLLASADPFSIVTHAHIRGTQDEMIDRLVVMLRLQLVKSLHDDAIAHAVDDDVNACRVRDGVDKVRQELSERGDALLIDRFIAAVVFHATLCGPAVADQRAVEGHVEAELCGAGDGVVEIDVEAMHEDEQVVEFGAGDLVVETAVELVFVKSFDQWETDEGVEFRVVFDGDESPFFSRGGEERIFATLVSRDRDMGVAVLREGE